MADGDQKAAHRVFVAYSYKRYPADDYREVYEKLAEEYSVSFVFADEKITNMHILDKIRSYIEAADFSIFDITGWNPNVTLELGIAMASAKDWYIAWNPSRTRVQDVPADLRGIDRIQYSSYTQLGDRLRALIEQKYPKRPEGIDQFLGDLSTQALDLLKDQPGLTMLELADVLGVSTSVAKLAVRPLVGKGLSTTGQRKGMKYYPDGQFPPPANPPLS